MGCARRWRRLRPGIREERRFNVTDGAPTIASGKPLDTAGWLYNYFAIELTASGLQEYFG